MLPVFPLSLQSSANQNNIKKNKMFAALYLPSYRDVLPESIVSFLEPMSLRGPAGEMQPGLVSLNIEGKRALQTYNTRVG
jgi:hypothetical protein